MRLYKEAFTTIAFSLLFSIGIVSNNAFGESQYVIVSPGEEETLTIYLESGDRIKFWISVDGGRNDDVMFTLRNPMGGTMSDGRIVESFSDEFKAQATGSYQFEFDNDISVISKKRVDFTYEIIKKPIFQAASEPAGSRGGGCLIATATFGTELAPEVQKLREIRENILLKTKSGSSFMSGFNQFYYSFSPTIADLERESPMFKETVKLAITPLLTSLSILNYVDIDSEEEMLGYGIGVILLNIGMYFVLPAIVIHRVRKFV